MAKAPPNAAMNMTELAEFLKVSRATLWKPAVGKQLPDAKIGKPRGLRRTPSTSG
jgi:hypothetical protein